MAKARHFERAPISEAVLDVRIRTPQRASLDRLTPIVDALSDAPPPHRS
jgi:hypothetical protein